MRRHQTALAIALAPVLLAGCTPGGEGDLPAPSQPSPAVPDHGSAAGTASPSAGGAEYRPGRAVEVDLPAGQPTAVVVLVPGGGWSSADPAGFAPLAEAFVADGFAVVTITYGTAGTGDLYPVPPADVACATAFAAAEVADLPVVLVGHSAGAHLAALVALVPDRDDSSCPSPPHAPDAVVGLAGVYDVSQAAGLAGNLFGSRPAQDPAAWQDGNPVSWVTERPEVPFLLLHGRSDDTVPDWFSVQFGRALEQGGHPVTVQLVDGADHMEVIGPDVVAATTSAWIRSDVLAP